MYLPCIFQYQYTVPCSPAVFIHPLSLYHLAYPLWSSSSLVSRYSASYSVHWLVTSPGQDSERPVKSCHLCHCVDTGTVTQMPSAGPQWQLSPPRCVLCSHSDIARTKSARGRLVTLQVCTMTLSRVCGELMGSGYLARLCVFLTGGVFL